MNHTNPLFEMYEKTFAPLMSDCSKEQNKKLEYSKAKVFTFPGGMRMPPRMRDFHLV